MVETIESGNLKLALFLFGEQGNPKNREPEWYVSESLPYVDEDGYWSPEGVSAAGITVEHLQFHCDWTWLMLVVEKIRNTEVCENIDINITCDCIIDGTDGKSIHIYVDSKQSTLDAVWLACVQFIEQYKLHQKENEE